MTKKELERKIAAALRKANRLKTPRLQIAKVNEAVSILQALMQPSLNVVAGAGQISPEQLSLYTELCRIHTLKFQMDGLFQSINAELKKIAKYPESMTHDVYDRLVKRLGVVLTIAPEHRDAQEKLELLAQSYPEFAEQNRPQQLLIDIAPYQANELTIDLEIPLQEITDHDQLRAVYKPYQTGSREPRNDETGTICQLRFPLKHVKDFELFHEELHTHATYHVIVNNLPLEEKIFSTWFQCYKKSLKANTPQYCYGASPFSLNVFGCHKLDMPDVAKSIERCWFHYGELDDETGLFILATDRIAERLRRQLYMCGFCPALSQEKLSIGLALLPKYVNPECDSRWQYFYQNDMRAGVLPAGHDVSISLTSFTSDQQTFPDLVEVSSTPCVGKALQYLVTRNLRDLQDISYTHLLSCVACGAPYRPHTMICSKCKHEFWKIALREVENVIPAIRVTQDVIPVLPETQSQKNSRIRQDVASLPKPEPEIIVVNAPEAQTPPVGIAIKKPTPQPLKSSSVSFDALWQDPAVQELLAPTSKGAGGASEDETKQPLNEAQAPITPTPPILAPAIMAENESLPPNLSERSKSTEPDPRNVPDKEEALHQRQNAPAKMELHEKLRGLMSKKYRERKAIEHAFAEPEDFTLSTDEHDAPVEDIPIYTRSVTQQAAETSLNGQSPVSGVSADEEVLTAIKQLRPRQKSELSKRGVVRVIYHATTDIETCPLCAYLDGMVMDPDDPATDIFSPPLFPGCTCRRAYVLKTEKPSNWPEVTFQFPPKKLLEFLEK